MKKEILMTSHNGENEKKKVPLYEHTYENLVDFSRFNGLKLCMLMDTLIDLPMQDEALRDRVIALTLEKQSDVSL